MSSRSARDQVLSLPELITAILIRLPIQDILINAQLVCHDWKAVVESLPVQQALFFAPLLSDLGLKAELNPLLEEKFPPWFKTPNRQGSMFDNPGWECKELDWGSSPKKCAAYKRKEASWRRMLPVQPPPTTFVVRQCWSSMVGQFVRVGEAKFEDGVRMGTLYDWAQKIVDMPVSSFDVKWHMCLPSGGEVARDTYERLPPHDVETPDQREKRARGKGLPIVTMRTEYTVQCDDASGGEPNTGPEFRSDGYEDLDISFSGARNIR